MNRFQNYSVLVVDDNIESLECMCEYLELKFSTVYKAMNAKEALKLAMNKKPDIIFTDIIMPDNDGFFLIEQINYSSLKIPIVIISAYSDKDKLLKAIRSDIVDYLVKPISSIKLKETMQLCARKLEGNGAYILLQDGFVWDKTRFLLLKQDEIIKLTKSETSVMKILIENIDLPTESIDIFYSLSDCEYKEFSLKNIRNIIYKIRKKIQSKNLIENIYGSKYMISSIR